MLRAVAAMARTINRRVVRPRRRHVLQVSLAGAAHAADRRQTLLVRREAAIGAAVAEKAAVIGAPRIILRFGATPDRRSGDDNYERDEQRAHGGPPDGSPFTGETPDDDDYFTRFSSKGAGSAGKRTEVSSHCDHSTPFAVETAAPRNSKSFLLAELYEECIIFKMHFPTQDRQLLPPAWPDSAMRTAPYEAD